MQADAELRWVVKVEVVVVSRVRRWVVELCWLAAGWLCFGRRLVAIARSSAKSGELRVESERTAAAVRPGCRLSRLHPD